MSRELDKKSKLFSKTGKFLELLRFFLIFTAKQIGHNAHMNKYLLRIAERIAPKWAYRHRFELNLRQVNQQTWLDLRIALQISETVEKRTLSGVVVPSSRK